MNNVSEIWKDIKNYENKYQVSNSGRIKSLKKDIILKPSVHYKGYLEVKLYKNNSSKVFKIHRLVASAFIPNPENKPQVNHIDGNKQNNCVDNLEWNTQSENQLHAFRNKLNRGSMYAKYSINNPHSKQVAQYDMNMNLIKIWGSTMEAQRNLNINNSHISACCLNKKNYKTAGGYKWKYID